MADFLPPLAAAISLRQIEVFHAVMMTGSLSDAGRMLSISQSAVSRILASAENRLRYPLFERIKGRLHPTPEAHRLFPEAQTIFEQVSRFNAMAASLGAGSGGKVNLVSSPSLSEWLIPRTIQHFREKNPDVVVRYRPLAFDMLLPHVLLGHADFGITSISPPANANVTTEQIGTGWLSCAIPRGHPLATKTRIRADDLRGHILIGYEPETFFGVMSRRFLNTSEHGINPNIETRSTPEALALVRQGIGVALIESFGYRPEFEREFVLRPTDPAMEHPIQLVHLAHTPLSNIARRFTQALRRAIKEAPKSY